MSVTTPLHQADERANGRAQLAEAMQLYSIEDLRNLPPVSWLIDRLLVARAFVVLYGPSGVGKSFFALDLALTVAAGTPWLDGSATTAGWVLYIAAEGSAGLTKRIDAWTAAREIPEPDRIRFLPDAVNLLDPRSVASAELTIAAMPEPPALIAIDTLARTLIGGDENSARDVGLFIAAVDQLRAAAGGCTALIVHHTGKKGDDERGSSALRGAADQMLALTHDTGGSLRLEFAKVKDHEPPAPLALQLATEGDSCAIQLGPDDRDDCPPKIGRTERLILEQLSAAFDDDAASRTRLKDSLPVSESTLDRSLKYLQHKGLLTRERSGRARFYALTPAGQNAHSSQSSNTRHDDRQRLSSRHTPLGVTSDDDDRGGDQ
jgi:DNA-binding MarR family transcriptional regulator